MYIYKRIKNMLLQLLFVLVAIIVGARLGGIGLGVMGGVGLAILTFVFGLQPTAPPIDVMLMIVAVISAASCMQAAGGLDYMVKLAERLLRRNPSQVTILSPLVTYLFTFVAGTGHVAYSVLPVIAEVATETKIRPERPLGIAVIASQQAITASPISAATVALLGLLTGFDITLFDILKITIPATLIGVLVGAFLSKKVGKELLEDPEYLRRLEAGMIDTKHVELNDVKNMFHARISVIIFIAATLLIVLFGSIPVMRPVFNGTALDMPAIIEILMLCAAAVILLISRTDGIKATQGSVFPAGMQAVIAIFGIAWMGDTFINGNITELTGSIEGIVRQMPWLFGLALFVMSILLYSQAATVRAIVPLGIALGISPMMLIALFPAVNGYFFIPNYPTVVAAINFDRTGTTGIGKWILNHSFMMPGMVATIVSIVVGLLLVQVF
ncbi:transporter, anaerobic C4-dicarboxylate uptake (Dcu) family protein [Phocaeicola vulgatus PC510]|uniref:Transporter, anaerobic C4-dicarboxylate uptake (Dcu) family protein n=5 Tax=Phocaeicola TaxID=909656 RepID=D4V9C8_PHOVU|nr:transporter, anaerobic C4-dicarboxylate uptake (Dcu) family protein [Phocaeicola vulgatus PC510]